MTKRRQYTAAFKARVVLEIISGAKSQAELARQHGIKPDLIGRWRRHFLENAPRLFEQETNGSSESQARLAELEQALGRQTLGLEVAKKASASFRRLADACWPTSWPAPIQSGPCAGCWASPPAAITTSRRRARRRRFRQR